MIRPPLEYVPILGPLGNGRGFTLDFPGVKPDSYWDALAATGARLARFWLPVTYDTSNTRLVWGANALQWMAQCVAKAGSRNIRLVVTVSPERAQEPDGRIWREPLLRSSLATLWAGLARDYSSNAVIAGFDICNEPMPPGANLRESNVAWFGHAQAIRDAIRAEDATRTIILEPSPQGRAMTHEFCLPVDVPAWTFDNVVWSYHMYEPFEFTHQLVPGLPFPNGQAYPGEIPLTNFPYGQYRVPPGPFQCDLAFLRSVLQPIREFQLRTRVPIYIGEFSATTSSAGRGRRAWVNDCITLFREYGWAWTFHQFRGAVEWDYEQDPQDWSLLLSALAQQP